jgi:hypothetical protein
MEHEIERIDVSELAALDKLTHALHRGRVSIREIDAQQPVGLACSLDDRARFSGGSREGLLAEHRAAVRESAPRLCRVLRARCRDDNAVEIDGEKLLQAVHCPSARDELERPCGGVALCIRDGDDIRLPVRDNRFHPMASDPSNAQEAEARTQAHGRGGRLLP